MHGSDGCMEIGIHPSHKMSRVYVQCVWSDQNIAACKGINDFHKSWLKLNDVHLRIVCVTYNMQVWWKSYNFVQLQLHCDSSIVYWHTTTWLHTQVKWIIPLNITRPRSPSLCDHLFSLSDCCRACEFIQHLSTLNFSDPPGEWVSCWQCECVHCQQPLDPHH